MYHKLSLTSGIPIGLIKGGEFDGKKIYIDKCEEKENQEFFLGVGKQHGEVHPLYHLQLEDLPNRYVISGMSGSGKTYITKEIVTDYLSQNPKNSVFLFSGVPKHKDKIFTCEDCRKILNSNKSDTAASQKKLDKCSSCHKINRVIIDESIIEDPLNCQDFENSMIIFDDIDRSFDPEIARELHKLCDNLMKSGRQDVNGVIYISQKLLEGNKSSVTNSNAFNTITFPNAGSKFQLINYLKTYKNLPNTMINKILDLPTRWVSINNCNPPYILHQKGCFIL